MKKYTLYWKSGDREVVSGDSIANAFSSSGYGAGALRALDFFLNGDVDEYRYDKDQHKWVRK